MKDPFYKHHWGGGLSERWITGSYLVSATFYTGSNVYVELLDHPGTRESGYFYMNETLDECVSRLISKIEYGWKHACWRIDSKRADIPEGGFYTIYGKIKYIDELTVDKIKEIEADPYFNCWEYINTYKWGEHVKKTVYNPIKFAYENLPHSI